MDPWVQFQAVAGNLRIAYWWIRYERSAGKRRQLYRRAAKERDALVSAGWPSEGVRLYSLWLKNPRLERRELRCKRFFGGLDAVV